MGSPSPRASNPLVLFDGVCNLCHGVVKWIIARDRQKQFRFASLQSQVAREILAAHESQRFPLPDSIVLLDEAGLHVKSDAAIRIARRLGWPWSWIGWTRVLPRGLRDAIYDWVARNRYRWFGRKDACLVPTPDLKERFLDAE